MDSTAVLGRGFSTAPPRLLPTTPSVVGRQLPLTFRCNVSSVHLLVEKSNKNYNRHGRLNKNNNGIDIQCSRVSTSASQSKDGGHFPSPNARLALQSLLCFSHTVKGVEHTDFINSEKKKALQKLLDQNPIEALKIMSKVYKKYQNEPNQQIKYDAILAFIQILIYMGTNESWETAIEKLNEILEMEGRPSEASPFLYQAIINTLLDNVDKRDVKEYWTHYVNLLDGDIPRPLLQG